MSTVSEATSNGKETYLPEFPEHDQKSLGSGSKNAKDVTDDTRENISDVASSAQDASKDSFNKTKNITDVPTERDSGALGGVKEKAGGLLGNTTDSAQSIDGQGEKSTDGVTDKASGVKNQVAEQSNETPAQPTATLSNLAPTDIVKDPNGIFADDGVGNVTSNVTKKGKGATDGVKDTAGGLVDKAQGETGEVTNKAKDATGQVHDTGKANTASMNGININTGDLMKAISPSGGGNLNGKGIEINVQTTKDGMSVTIKIPTFQ